MTGHAFIQHFIQNEELLVVCVIRHYAISASLHMCSPFITFAFMHLADAFIQSDLQCIQVIYVFIVSKCVP